MSTTVKLQPNMAACTFYFKSLQKFPRVFVMGEKSLLVLSQSNSEVFIKWLLHVLTVLCGCFLCSSYIEKVCCKSLSFYKIKSWPVIPEVIGSEWQTLKETNLAYSNINPIKITLFLLSSKLFALTCKFFLIFLVQLWTFMCHTNWCFFYFYKLKLLFLKIVFNTI